MATNPIKQRTPKTAPPSPYSLLALPEVSSLSPGMPPDPRVDHLQSSSKDVLRAVEAGDFEGLDNFGKDALLATRDDEADGMTPLLTAVKRGTSRTVLHLVELLGDGCLADRTDTGMTCLHLAAERGNDSTDEGESAAVMLGVLLDDFKGKPELPHVDARDKRSFAPLHVASMCGDVDAALCLLRHGCDVGATNERGSTPLHWACSRGHTKVGDTLSIS